MEVCIKVCVGVCIGGVKHAPFHEFPPGMEPWDFMIGITGTWAGGHTTCSSSARVVTYDAWKLRVAHLRGDSAPSGAEMACCTCTVVSLRYNGMSWMLIDDDDDDDDDDYVVEGVRNLARVFTHLELYVNSVYRAVPCEVVTSISCRVCSLHGEHVVSYLVWPASGFRLLWAFTFLEKVYVLVTVCGWFSGGNSSCP